MEIWLQYLRDRASKMNYWIILLQHSRKARLVGLILNGCRKNRWRLTYTCKCVSFFTHASRIALGTSSTAWNFSSSLRMDCNNCLSFTFHLVLSSGQNFNLSETLVYDQWICLISKRETWIRAGVNSKCLVVAVGPKALRLSCHIYPKICSNSESVL